MSKSLHLLMTQDELTNVIVNLANEFVTNENLIDESYVFVPLLTGASIFSSMFLNEVFKQLHEKLVNVHGLDLNDCADIYCKHKLVPVTAKSYEGDKSTGQVKIKSTIDDSKLAELLSDSIVVIIDDIYDTGLTLHKVTEVIKSAFNPIDVKSVVLFEKEEVQRPVGIKKPDYVGIKIPNKFVVGFGLDYDECCRFIPFLGYFE